tara:strand:- start:1420 stop:2079 length:660 start_codon:yes stop_codon:yes gene_type:complete
METITKFKKNPSKVLAIELLALNPRLKNGEIAEKVGISSRTLELWKTDPNFVDAVYERYMLEFGIEVPAVLNAMVREAKEGNVQAGRLVLEHSGKLVKNINVTVDSPFEKFLKGVQNAEIVEDGEIIDVATEIINDSSLPERNTENQDVRAKNEKIKTAKAIKEAEKKADYNKKQREWYLWRKRAKKAGVSPLKNRRPTPAQRKEWEREIIKAESNEIV